MKLECDAEEWVRIFFGKPRLPEMEPSSLVPRDYASFPHMKFTKAVYKQIMDQLAPLKPERGGMILGPDNQQFVSHFVLDDTGMGTGGSWTFGHKRLNEILKEYLALGLDCKGFIHSHPPGYQSLSQQDVIEFGKDFRNPKHQDLDEIWLPIIVDGLLYPYILYRNKPDQPVSAQLVLC
jgi:hypothetical protein